MPGCGTPTIKPEGGVWTICPNRAGCPGQVLQAVKHFIGAMDIDGFGEETAIRFLREKVIESAPDIYSLDEERLVGLEGFGEVSARNLLASIEQSKQQPFFRVLYGLGIEGVGWVNARALANHFRSIDALLAASEEELQETDGIGPVMARTRRTDAPGGAHARADRALPRRGAESRAGGRASAAPRRARCPARRSCSPARCRT